MGHRPFPTVSGKTEGGGKLENVRDAALFQLPLGKLRGREVKKCLGHRPFPTASGKTEGEGS